MKAQQHTNSITRSEHPHNTPRLPAFDEAMQKSNTSLQPSKLPSRVAHRKRIQQHQHHLQELEVCIRQAPGVEMSSKKKNDHPAIWEVKQYQQQAEATLKHLNSGLLRQLLVTDDANSYHL